MDTKRTKLQKELEESGKVVEKLERGYEILDKELSNAKAKCINSEINYENIKKLLYDVTKEYKNEVEKYEKLEQELWKEGLVN